MPATTPPDLLAVLAEPNRRRLLALLGAGERSAGDLATEFAVTRSAISQHLTVLVEAGLVVARHDGRYRHYRLVPEGMAALRAQIDEFWTTELDLLALAGRPPQGTTPMPYDKSVFLPVSPDEAFALVTEPERLRRWLAVAARVDLRAGGSYRWTVTSGHRAAGTITEVEPGRRLVLGFGWEDDETLPPDASTVTISITPGDGGTFVRLVHEGLDAAQQAQHAKGWDHYLDRLVACATEGDAGRDTWMDDSRPLDQLRSAEVSLAICLDVLRGLDATDGSRPVPSCPDFTIDHLLGHLTMSLTRLAQAGGADAGALDALGTPGESGPTDQAEVRIADLATLGLEAWHVRGLDGDTAMGPFPLPATVVAGIYTVELLVHGWDVAQAIGAKPEISDALATYALGCVDAVAEVGLRTPERFGAVVDVAPDADPLTRLLAATGRNA